MEAWSPYVSNCNNPISYNEFLGDESDDDPPTGIRGFWISTAGLVNGVNHIIAGGLYDTPASAFGWSGEDAERYDNMTTVGSIIPLFFGPKVSPGQLPMVPVNFEPMPVPAPVPVPVVAPVKPVVKKKRRGTARVDG